MIECAKDIPLAARQISNQLAEPNPDCQLVVVIPVYKEYQHGRIAKLLAELDHQTIGRKHFETVLVVNNAGLRKNPAEEDGYRDNLALVDFIRSQKLQGTFDNVQLIDCTEGQLPTRHLGLARGLGNELAQIRLAQTDKGDSGLVVQMDADTSVDPDFLDHLNTAFQIEPLAESACIPRSPLPVDYSSDDLYLHYAEQFLRTVEYLREGRNPKAFNGSTLTFRAYLHQRPEIRTYMGYSWNEDYRLGEDLFENSRFIYLPEPRIFVADRRRLEGFDANFRCTLHLDPSPPLQDEETRFLAREELLARSRLDWDRVDPSLVKAGILLFCQGRQLMGHTQMLKAYIMQQ